MTNYGYTLDVAAFQPQAVYYDFWSKWKARGVKGGIVKLTESTWYVNDTPQVRLPLLSMKDWQYLVIISHGSGGIHTRPCKKPTSLLLVLGR